jgi:hypothetical protein
MIPLSRSGRITFTPAYTNVFLARPFLRNCRLSVFNRINHDVVAVCDNVASGASLVPIAPSFPETALT